MSRISRQSLTSSTSAVHVPSRREQLWHAVRASQPSQSSWPSALRRGLLVAVLVAIGALSGEFATASIIAVGALNMGLVDAAVPRQTLARTLIAVAVLGGFVAFVASALAGTWWTVALLAVLAYLSGAIGSLGLVAFNTTFMTLVMAVLFTNDPGDVDNSLRLGILVLLGGLLQAASSIIAWRYDRDASLRRKLSLTFDALSELAEFGEFGGHAGQNTTTTTGAPRRKDSTASIRMSAADKEHAAEQAIADAGLSPARTSLFNNVIIELNWTRLCLTTWLTTGNPTPAKREQITSALADADWSLHHHARPTRAAPAAPKAATSQSVTSQSATSQSATSQSATSQPTSDDPAWTTLVEQLATLHAATHRLRAEGLTSAPRRQADTSAAQQQTSHTTAAKQAAQATQATQASSRVSSDGGAESARPLGRIGQFVLPSSPTFRQAIRLALAVAIAQSIAIGFDLERGYWLPLTVVMVVKPDFSTTLIRGSLRIFGTIAAVLLVGVLLEATGNPQWLMVVLAAIFAPLTMRWISANYAFGAFAISSAVLVLIEAGDPEGATIVLRLENTLMGVAIAIAVYVIFPSWSGNKLLPALATMVQAQRAWTQQVLTGLQSGHPDAQTLRTAGRDSRDALLAAQPLVDQANLEPHRAPCDPNAAFSLISACHRAAVATLALEVASRQPLHLSDHDAVHRTVDHTVEPTVDRAVDRTVDRIDHDLADACAVMSHAVDEYTRSANSSHSPHSDGPVTNPDLASQVEVDASADPAVNAPADTAPLARIDSTALKNAATQNAVDALEKLVTAAATTVVAAERIRSGR